MNKTNKRQLNLRNKLFAAIAMLLVSSIMMVSTTYAWFTLSTAPEVQGITTTVGANGNLEIALSPADGLASGIGSAMGDSTLDWVAKNQTWGNLLDLSSTSYGLEAITLLPARLNIGNVGINPLKTPVYGADGRVEKLEALTNFAQPEQTANGYTYNVSTTFRGVRAVGTSSSMTKYQITYNNYLASLSQNAAAARDLAEVSLKNNGAQLANMAVTHATAGSEDTKDYSTYKDAMNSVLTDLENANVKLKTAIRDALIATAATAYEGNNEATYDSFMALVESNNTLEQLMTAAGVAFDSTTGEASATGFVSAICTYYNDWLAINTRLTAARKEYNDNIASAATVNWSAATKVLTYLMETTGIKMNGYGLSEFKTHANRYLHKPGSDGWEAYYKNEDGSTMSTEEANTAFNNANSVISPFTQGKGEMQLGTGSGIYAEIAVMVGNLSAPINVDIEYGSISLYNIPITIKTTTAVPADSGKMGTARVNLANATVYTDANAETKGVLNETYGYIVDFFFRTNASNSNLLLQSDPAQRVYSDASSAETLGNGSSMTFRTGNINGNAVENLMECIRVVFLDTTNYEILGIAALDMTNATQKVVTAGAEGAADIVDITAKLYLHNYTENADTGRLELGTAKTAVTDTVLCALPTNTAKAVSVMVYLDGDNVTNADVANAATSTTGSLNLQFASSETLVPMDNEALKNMAESTKYTVSVDNTSGAMVNTSSSTVKEGTDYNFNVNGSDYAVSYKVTKADGSETTTTINAASTNGTVNYYTIPAADVKGDITIIVTNTAAGGSTGDQTTTYTADTTTNVSDATVSGSFTDDTYSFTVTADEGYTVKSVSYKMGDAADATVVTATDGTYTISNVTGNLVIYVETEATTTPSDGQ